MNVSVIGKLLVVEQVLHFMASSFLFVIRSCFNYTMLGLSCQSFSFQHFFFDEELDYHGRVTFEEFTAHPFQSSCKRV